MLLIREILQMDSKFNSALIIAGAIVMTSDELWNYKIAVSAILIISGIFLQIFPFIKERFK